MKEFKGTPGIWQVNGLDVETEDYYVCNVADYLLDERFDFSDAKLISESNANLIAAAPDLLAALQDVLYELSTTREVHDGTIRQADAAIARALGEKQ